MAFFTPFEDQIIVRLAAADALHNDSLDEEAEAAYRSLLQDVEAKLGAKAPQAITIHLSLGDILVTQENFTEALEAYRAALALMKECSGQEYASPIDVRMKIADVLFRLDSFEDAESEYRAILEWCGKIQITTNSPEPQARERLASMLWDRGMCEEAEREIRLALDYQKREFLEVTADNKLQLARYLSLQGKFAESEKMVRQLIDDFERYGFFHMWSNFYYEKLADLLSNQGKFEEAENEYRRIGASAAKEKDEYKELEMSLLSASMAGKISERRPEAIVTLRNLIDRTSDNQERQDIKLMAHKEISEIYLLENSYPESERECNAVLKDMEPSGILGPECFYGIRNCLVEALVFQGKNAEGLLEVKRLIRDQNEDCGQLDEDTFELCRVLVAHFQEQGMPKDANYITEILEEDIKKSEVY